MIGISLLLEGLPFITAMIFIMDTDAAADIILWENEAGTSSGTCPPFECDLPCPVFGYRKDSNHCNLCECIEWDDEVHGNSDRYEGDMVMTKSMRYWLLLNTVNGIEALENGAVDTSKAMGAAGNVPIWTNRKEGNNYVVPYEIDSSIGSKGIAAIEAAAADFKKYTCILLRPRRSGETPYIQYFSDDGCYSPVGQTGQSRQQVSLGLGCQYKGTAIHETLHSLGFFHEQSRSDRDQHINIIEENIVNGMGYNFNKMSPSELKDLKTPYDIGSVMQYSSYAFSKDRKSPTITDINGNVLKTQRDGFSTIDIEEVNKLYQCPKTGTTEAPVTTAVPTTEVTTKPTTATTAGTTDPSCLDRYRSCKRWAAKGDCTKRSEIPFMRKYCCSSCRALTTPAPTTTARPTTTRTTTRKTTTASTVRPTTGTTTDATCADTTRFCKRWAERGECTKYPSYMSTRCCKSCADIKTTTKAPTTTTADPNCQDYTRHCRIWAQRGKCQAYDLSEFCCKSCSK